MLWSHSDSNVVFVPHYFSVVLVGLQDQSKYLRALADTCHLSLILLSLRNSLMEYSLILPRGKNHVFSLVIELCDVFSVESGLYLRQMTIERRSGKRIMHTELVR